MKNIHVLQTAQPSRLFYFNNELRLEHNTVERKTNQNIYITSDEKIKKGDCFIENGKYIFNGSSSPVSDTFIPRRNQKIILTTDQNLIKERVQAINDEFLEWFVKNPSCEEVEVLHQDVYSMGKWDRRSNIIIPKETPKQNLEKDMFELEQELDIPSHLRFHNSKQETLEEAAQSHLSKVADGKRTTGYADEDFIAGAIWQQQRSYTEEEMKLFARSYFREIKLDTTNTLWSDLADRCFEEFKKKVN